MTRRIVFILALCAGPVHASTALVPAEYQTLQAAVNSGADTIRVDQGTFPDSTVITRAVVIEPTVPPYPWPEPFPTIGPVAFVPSAGSIDPATVRNMHIAGYLRLGGHLGADHIHVLACRIDDGIEVFSDFSVLEIQGCLVYGTIDLYSSYADVTACTVIGGGVRVWSNGRGRVANCYIRGPADAGIFTANACNSVVTVRENDIAGVVDGIVAQTCGSYDDNLIYGCSGHGVRVNTNGATFQGNRVRRCALNGFELAPRYLSVTLTANQVDSVGGAGIHVPSDAAAQLVASNVISVTGGAGIWCEGLVLRVTGNRVLRAGTQGILLGAESAADHNVVGRCAAAGIATLGTAGVRCNTSYLNSGPGYALAGAPGDSVDHNIAFLNTGVGLAWSGTGTPMLDCNDWYGNSAGATSGVAPGATDLAVDPQFCNVTLDSVTLESTSPLLDEPGCGRVGALGQGCVVASGVPGVADARGALALRVMPQPATGPLVFTWPARQGIAEIAVFDIAGARRWSTRLDAQRGAFAWSARDLSGQPVAPGTYFARISVAGEVARSRVVLIR